MGTALVWQTASPVSVVPSAPNLARKTCSSVRPRSGEPLTKMRRSRATRSSALTSSFAAATAKSSALTFCAAIRTALPMW
jgi:hypothetical protein